MTAQTLTLPYLRTTPVHIPRRDIVLSAADSLLLTVVVVQSDHPSAETLILTTDVNGPTLQLVLWEDRHHPCGWGDYGYGYVMPDAVLYSQPGTPGGASGSWDFHVPTGSFADFPLRCGWAVLLLWGDGAKSSVLAQGIAQVVRPHFTGVKISALPPPVDPPIIPPVMPSHVGLITSATLLPIMTSDTDRQLETS